MAVLTKSTTYSNPYEEARHNLQGLAQFDASVWDMKARQGKLNEYIGVLSDSMHKLNFTEFSAMPEYKHLTAEQKYDAMVNEMYEDREKIKSFTDSFIDEYGQEQTKTFVGTQYEYNKHVLKTLSEYNLQQAIYARQEKLKQEMSGLARFGADVAAATGELVLSAVEQVEDVLTIPYAIGAGIATAVEGKGFDAGFRGAYTADSGINYTQVVENSGIAEALFEFERLYTDFYTADGKQTNAGKVVISTVDSFGKMVPSMLINLIPGAGVAGEVVYWTGLTSNNFKEMANTLPASVSTTHMLFDAAAKGTAEWAVSKIMQNAFGPTVQDKLSFNAKFKATSKIGGTVGRVAKQFVTDAVKEGTEEVLQDLYSFIIDRGFALIDKNFGNVSDFNLQTMMDAFVLGAMGSIASGAVDVAFTKRVETGETKTTRRGDTIVKKLGKMKSWLYHQDMQAMMNSYDQIIRNDDLSLEERSTALFDMYTSYRTMSSLFGALGEERWKSAANMLSKMLDENAVKVHNKQDIQTAAYLLATHAKTFEDDRKAGIKDTAVDDAKKGMKVVANADESDEDTELGNAIRTIFNSDRSITTVVSSDTATAPTLVEISLDGEPKPKSKAVVVPTNLLKVDDGTNIVKSLTEEMTVEEILNTVAEIPQYKDALDYLTSLYKEVNEADIKRMPRKTEHELRLQRQADAKAEAEAMSALRYKAKQKARQEAKAKTDTDNVDARASDALLAFMYSETFYQVALYSSYRQVFNMLLCIDKTIESLATDTAVRTSLEKAYASRRAILVSYVANQTALSDADVADLVNRGLLTPKELSYVRRRRYSKNLAQRVLSDDEYLLLSEQDKRVLRSRVNGLVNLTSAQKNIILENLVSSKRDLRANALFLIDRQYAGMFSGEYNGKKYPIIRSTADAVFAAWLKNNGYTLEDIRNTRISPTTGKLHWEDMREQFEATNPGYTFTVTESAIVASKTKRGYENNELSDFVASGKQFVETEEELSERTMSVLYTEKDTILPTLLKSTLPVGLKDSVGITDVIYDPSLLDDKVAKQIKDEYGDSTPDSVFSFLKSHYITSTGSISIVLSPNGRYNLVNVAPMLKAWKPKSDTWGKLVEKAAAGRTGHATLGKLGDFIDEKFLWGGMKDVIVEYGGNGSGSYYDPERNTIVIDPSECMSTYGQVKDGTSVDKEYSVDDYDQTVIDKWSTAFRFVLLHEFQHVIDTYSGLSEGLEETFLSGHVGESGTRVLHEALVSDFKQHEPQLYEKLTTITENDELELNELKEELKRAEVRLAQAKSNAITHKGGLTEASAYDIGVAEHSVSSLKYEIANYKHLKLLKGIEQHLYYTSGEYSAYGLQNYKGIRNEFPTIVHTESTGETILTAPWGKSYVINSKISSFWYDEKSPIHKELSASFETILDEYNPKASPLQKGFISPDGQIGFFRSDEAIHLQIELAALNTINTPLAMYAYLSDSITITNDDITYTDKGMPQWSVNTSQKHYVVRMRREANWAQKEALEKFVKEANAAGRTVILHDMYGSSSVSIAPGDDYEEALKEYHKEWSRAKAHIDKYRDINSGTQIQQDIRFIKSGLFASTTPSLFGRDGIILEDGYFGWSSNTTPHYMMTDKQRRALELASVDCGAIEIRRFLSDYYVIELPRFYSSYQLDKLLDFVKTELKNDSTVELYLDDAENSIKLSSDIPPQTIESVFKAITSRCNAYLDESDTDLMDTHNTYITELGLNLQTLYFGHERANASHKRKQSFAKQPPQKRRKVTKSELDDHPNLKPFRDKNRLLPEQTRNFIIEADPAQLAPELLDFITGEHAGDFNERTALQYLRTADTIDDYTFKLLHKHFFPDSPIKTFEQLEKLVLYSDSIYALKDAVTEMAGADALYTEISFDALEQIIAKLTTSKSKIAKQFAKDRKSYPSEEINSARARVMYMDSFTGSIASARSVAAKLRNAVYAGYDKLKEVSLDKVIARDKDGKGQTLIDKIAGVPDEYNFDDELDAITAELADKTREQKLELIFRYYAISALEKLHKDGKKVSQSKIASIKEKFMRDHASTSLEEIDARYVMIKYKRSNAESTGVSDADIALSTTLVKNRTNVIANIKGLAQTVKSNLSTKELKKLSELYPELFTEKGNLKKSAYYKVETEVLFKTEELMRRLAHDAKLHIFSKKSTAKELNNLRERLNKYRTTTKKLYAEIKELKAVKKKVEYIVLQDSDVQLTTTEEMPKALVQILSVSLEKTAKSSSQFVTAEDDYHVKVGSQDFFRMNAEVLSDLTQADVDEIIEFYSDAIITGGLTDVGLRKYEVFKVLLLGYIKSEVRRGRFLLTEEQTEKLDKALDFSSSLASQVQTAWRDALKRIDPNKEIVQAMANRYGLTARQVDLDRLSMVLEGTNPRYRGPEAFAEARAELKKNLIADNEKKYGHKDLLTRIENFQRVAMLSSPATWIRNKLSNIVIDAGDSIASKIGTFFGKKFTKEGQYKIVGTKVTKESEDFVKMLLDSQFLRDIATAASKYDTRKITSHSPTDIVVDMIAQSFAAEIQYANQFNTPKLNDITKWIFARLSDDKEVHKRAIYYMSRMFVEEGVDLQYFDRTRIGLPEYIPPQPDGVKKSDKLWRSEVTFKQEKTTPQVLKIIAEAFRMASMDYMHKANIFNKLESLILEKGGKPALFVWKQFFPFASASWNWFCEGLKYSPIGLAQGVVKLARLEKSIENIERKRQRGEVAYSAKFTEYIARRDIGKGIIGSIGMLAGILLHAFGAAKLDEKDGKVKLHIGDSGVSVDISGVFGTQGIFLGIAVAEAMSDKDNNFGDVAAAIVTQLFNDSMLNDMYNDFRYSESIGDLLLSKPEDTLSMLIPNALKAITSLTVTDKLKYSPGLKGTAQRLLVQATGALGALIMNVPTRTDIYTGENQTKYAVPFLLDAINKVSPVKVYAYNISDIEKEAIAIGITKNELSGKYKDIGTLSDGERKKLNTFYGELNNKTLTELINNKSKFVVDDVELYYKDMTKEQKESVFTSIMSKNANYAKIYAWTTSGHKYYASKYMYDNLKEIGIEKNVYLKTAKLEGFVK